MFFDQGEFDIRCEWGKHGVDTLAPISDVVIIVDVLSFSTSVNIAVDNGAVVFPYAHRDEQAAEFAAAVNAQLAEPMRSESRYSLSPQALTRLPPGFRIVLPSPNGATLALAARKTPVLAGCLRNARAVAQAAQKFGPMIAVIPAGERWLDDDSLRPSFEDLVGAGAIISHLNGRLSPEAVSAVAAFQSTRNRLFEYLRQCSSGKELIELGFPEDVNLASRLDASNSAPVLIDGAFMRSSQERR